MYCHGVSSNIPISIIIIIIIITAVSNAVKQHINQNMSNATQTGSEIELRLSEITHRRMIDNPKKLLLLLKLHDFSMTIRLLRVW